MRLVVPSLPLHHHHCFFLLQFDFPTALLHFYSLYSFLLLQTHSLLSTFKISQNSLFVFLHFPAMTSSSPTSSGIAHAQSALNDIMVQKICRECEIPSDCKLEVLGHQYSEWRSDPSMLLITLRNKSYLFF